MAHCGLQPVMLLTGCSLVNHDTLWFTASDAVDRLFSGESWHIANVILSRQLYVSHAVHFVGQLITNTDECL